MIIVLLIHAGPLNINNAVYSSKVRAILDCFFPAQSGGEAIRHVLLNDIMGANPAGRLPFTWPASLDDVIHTNFILSNYHHYIKCRIL